MMTGPNQLNFETQQTGIQQLPIISRSAAVSPLRLHEYKPIIQPHRINEKRLKLAFQEKEAKHQTFM